MKKIIAKEAREITEARKEKEFSDQDLEKIYNEIRTAANNAEYYVDIDIYIDNMKNLMKQLTEDGYSVAYEKEKDHYSVNISW